MYQLKFNGNLVWMLLYNCIVCSLLQQDFNSRKRFASSLYFNKNAHWNISGLKSFRIQSFWKILVSFKKHLITSLYLEAEAMRATCEWLRKPVLENVNQSGSVLGYQIIKSTWDLISTSVSLKTCSLNRA